MKFSNELMDELDNIENFSNLSKKDPQVIAIQEKFEMELLAMERITAMKLQLEIKDLLGNITKDTLTPAMYYYLFNKGLSSADIYDHLNIPKYVYTKWTTLKGLHKNDMYLYELFDVGNTDLIFRNTANVEPVKTFHRLTHVSDYLEVPNTRIHDSIGSNCTIKGRYVVEKRPKFEPTLADTLDYDYKDTLGYWLENRKRGRGKQVAGRSERVTVLMADIFGKGGVEV